MHCPMFNGPGVRSMLEGELVLGDSYMCGMIENPMKLLFQVTLSPAEELLNIVGGIRNKVTNWHILFLLQCLPGPLFGSSRESPT